MTSDNTTLFAHLIPEINVTICREEMNRLPPRFAPILPRQDLPQKPVQRACRKVFFPLDLY